MFSQGRRGSDFLRPRRLFVESVKNVYLTIDKRLAKSYLKLFDIFRSTEDGCSIFALCLGGERSLKCLQ